MRAAGGRVGAAMGTILAAVLLAAPAVLPVAPAAASPATAPEPPPRWPAFPTAISARGGVVAFVEVQSGPQPGPYYVHYLRDRNRGVTIAVGARIPAYLGITPTAALSADGRYVTATTSAVSGPLQLALLDTWWGQYRPVSVDPAGGPADDISTDPALAAGGRYLAFASYATNLVAGDGNGTWDVFVRDLGADRTERVSVAGRAGPADGASYTPSISADGRYVAFASDATNLVAGDTNGARDVFVRDRLTGTTQRVSVDGRGRQGAGSSYTPSISADGRYVTFTSTAVSLAGPGDRNGAPDVFVRDRRYGTTHRLSLDSHSQPGNDGSYDASISADGRYAAFASDATNLVAGDTNELPDVFVRDLAFGTTRRASLNVTGRQGNGLAGNPVLSGSGRYLAFAADSADLVPEHVPDTMDVFVRDLWSHLTYWVNVDTTG